MPPVRTRVGIVHALRDLNPTLLARLAKALDVAPEHLPARKRPDVVPEAAASLALQSALLEAMELLPNESAKRVREAVLKVVGAIAELGLDARAAEKILRARR